MWSAGKFAVAALTILLEAVEPLLGCLSGYAKAFCQFSNGGLVQLVVLEESLSLSRHDNTFPGHGLKPPHPESVTYVFE